ncbi:hypothetical protein [Goekera deserti]|uniref:hypothetical protein n=1 Tax=Goekera deserti TaxID=2497753 RepID=UPI0018788B6D|nr:hypothetical protein [Goekera deserti]
MAADTAPLDEVSAPIADLRAGLATLRAAPGHHGADSTLAQAQQARDVLLPAMATVRAADLLETHVADDLRPLPSYQDMLVVL